MPLGQSAPSPQWSASEPNFLIIVTGIIGIGKTTVCRKLIELVRWHGHSCGGILAYTASGETIIIEDIQTGEKEILASTKQVYPGPHTPRYSFNPKGIDFGIRVISEGKSKDVLIVDEIGHLELRGEGFYSVLEIIRSSEVQFCVLVIRQELLANFIPRFKPVEPVIFETTKNNRNQVPEEILEELDKGLR